MTNTEPYPVGTKEWWTVRRVANGGARRPWYELTDEDRQALTRPATAQEQREAVARLAALHGIGRIDGLGNREPPNEKWTQGEWERRILECVPGAVELQCYTLADAILALVNAEALRPLAARAEAAEARASALVETCKPLLERWDLFRAMNGNQAEAYHFLVKGQWAAWDALRTAHDAALNRGAE